MNPYMDPMNSGMQPIGQYIGQEMPVGQQQPNGLVQQILSSRFQPSYEDVGNSALAGVAGDTYVNPQSFTDNRMNNALKQIQVAGQLQKDMAMSQLYAAGGPGNATIKAAQAIMAERPDLDFVTAFSMAKSGLGQGVTYQNGQVVPMPNAPQAAGAMAQGKQEGEERARLGYAGPIETEKVRGENKGKKEANLPKATAGMQSALQSNDVVNQNITKALAASGDWTTGFTGSIAKNIPGNKAYDLARTVDTIKANVGFDKLAQMRANSPTGGALGQVSDFENRMLQSVIANLEQSQTKEQFEANLLAVSQQYVKSMTNLRQAYMNDYGDTVGFDEMFSQLPPAPSAPAGRITPEQAAAELARRRGGQ